MAPYNEFSIWNSMCLLEQGDKHVKKKLILMCIAGALVMTAVIGGTLAGFNTETDSKGVTDIKVKTLSIDVSDKNDSEDGQTGVMEFSEPAVPGKEIIIDRIIKNTGSYDLYARVTVNKKWADNLDAKMIKLGMKSDGWLVVNEDDEQIIMYRQAPLKVGESVAVPVKSLSFDTSMTNEYAGKSCEFDITVDAVQAAMAEESMPSEWGVYPVLSEDGVITAIEE